ncbi:IS701 family transposase [Streptomyces sp. NPDC017520]|uniref:IS701 family transposase n=1 Tax=Streptomyces sp. NPDC017520 TaxID=3364998 RepID=UPI0037AEDB3F
MLNLDLYPAGTKQEDLAPFATTFHDAALAELCSILFTSFSRSDQCAKGRQYLRGLLETRGRKSIRNIAALLGDQVSEQNLHHFISGSTWDWIPIRRALALHVTETFPPEAWVVKSMIIPKAGQHSVGVHKQFFPALRQVVNAQQAIGVWAVSEAMSAPVNWRLLLPPDWIRDELRRNQVSIPDQTGVETVSESVSRACLETMKGWQLPVRPVVLDTCEPHVASIFREFRATRTPLLVRVDRDLRLTVTDPVLPAHIGKQLPASHLMSLVQDLRRPVRRRGQEPDAAHRTQLAATVQVCLPPSPALPAGQGELLLLGVGGEGVPWPAGLWLTNLTNLSTVLLARLSRLVEKVDRDFTEIADQVGIRDFAGRSFGGWHRHITLASAAHAVVSLAGVSP